MVWENFKIAFQFTLTRESIYLQQIYDKDIVDQITRKCHSLYENFYLFSTKNFAEHLRNLMNANQRKVAYTPWVFSWVLMNVYMRLNVLASNSARMYLCAYKFTHISLLRLSVPT